MKYPLWTLANAIIGGVAGYLITIGKAQIGIILFCVAFLLILSKAIED